MVALLYIVSAKMWLIVKIDVLNSEFPYSFNFVYWPPYLFSIFICFYCVILIRKTSKQIIFIWHKACI